jgi:hypothetical protein
VVLAHGLYAEAPIDTVQKVFGLFSYGGIIEALVMQGVSRKDAQGGAQDVEFEMRSI